MQRFPSVRLLVAGIFLASPFHLIASPDTAIKDEAVAGVEKQQAALAQSPERDAQGNVGP